MTFSSQNCNFFIKMLHSHIDHKIMTICVSTYASQNHTVAYSFLGVFPECNIIQAEIKM